MKKAKRNILRWTAGLLFLCLLISITGFLLVSRYQKIIHDLAIEEINHHVNGSVTLGEITATFFSTFPYPSISFSDMMIRDSMWEQHQHDLLKAKKIKIYFEWLSLLKAKPIVSKVVVQNAILHIYKDKNGYSNFSEPEHPPSNSGHANFPEFNFQYTRIILENGMKNSLHDIDAELLICKITKKDTAALLQFTIKSQVHGVGFNLEKGSYLTEKSMKGKFQLLYYPKSRIELHDVQLDIEHHPFTINGNINLGLDTMTYDLLFQAKKVKYQEAAALLTQSIQNSIKIVDILDPFDIEASISGQIAQKVVPRISTKFSIKDAAMETPIGHLEKCTFDGTFNNQEDASAYPGDANSKFTFSNLSVDWNHFSFTSNHLNITNLLNPVLDCQLASTFPLADLNALGELETITFLKGIGKLNVMYHGSLSDDVNIVPGLNGTFSLQDAALYYEPRELTFKQCNGEIEFKEQDMIMKNLSASVGGSTFTMKGRIDNLLTMINKQPEKLILNLSVSANTLDLGDFISYVHTSKPAKSKKSGQKSKIIQLTENTEKMLRKGTAKLTINAGELHYKKFSATQVNAAIFLETDKITLSDVRLQHAKGAASLKGSLINAPETNKLNLEASVNRMDIPLLFTAFDNFDQDAITAANTKGFLTAKIKITGEITDKALVKENTMKGQIDFSLVDGELNQFEPMMKLTDVAFKKRDFSNIKFAEIKNKFAITGSTYQIPFMEIRSNVVVLFVEGIYDTKNGTDLSIQVPVDNLTKAEHDIEEFKGKPGVNVRLRAKTGSDGKLKVSWDPLNNGTKQRNPDLKKERTSGSRKDKQ